MKPIPVDAPFRQPPHALYWPRAFREPPVLDTRPPRGGSARSHALLINPFYPKDPRASFGKHVLTPTLALTSVAAATPEDWTVAYFDENLLQGSPPCDPVPEVVGITVHLTFAERAYQLAAYYRALGAVVVLGGLHVMSCPDEAQAHADVVAMGDGVALWPRILRDQRAGRLQSRYHASFTDDYRDPQPRRDLIPSRSFLTTLSLNATRGCRNRCDFCYLSTAGLKTPWRAAPIEQVVAQIRASDEPYLVFTDNNLGADRAHLAELCRALEPLRRIWSAAVTLDVTDDPGLVGAMARAGCSGVFVGIESLSDDNLRDSRKRAPPAADAARRVGVFHDHGIQVNGSFVVGFDHDRRDVFARTAQWIETARLECATFHILTPYPGTPLFSRLEAEGRILTRNWAQYDTAHVVFRPRHMSPEELARGYGWLYERLFSHASIWLRRPSNELRSMLPYLGGAYLYKRANWLWHWIIRARLVHPLWQPLVHAMRLGRGRGRLLKMCSASPTAVSTRASPGSQGREAPI